MLGDPQRADLATLPDVEQGGGRPSESRCTTAREQTWRREGSAGARRVGRPRRAGYLHALLEEGGYVAAQHALQLRRVAHAEPERATRPRERREQARLRAKHAGAGCKGCRDAEGERSARTDRALVGEGHGEGTLPRRRATLLSEEPSPEPR
eukprot:4133423-Prymnesium_polylepis.1